MDWGSAIRFPFPFPPYAIQQQFMEALHDTISSGRCGVFESRTGTVRKCSMFYSHTLLHTDPYCAGKDAKLDF